MRILLYSSLPAEFHDYDPDGVEVARLLRDAIQSADSQLQVDHVGSTSVPGCSGKGAIDLAVLYPKGHLACARTTLDRLGFQKQSGTEPFSEDRPMRVGSLKHNGRRFQIHAHVVAVGSDEHGELVWFRERLRGDPLLRQRYEERKRAILANGISDSLEYCRAKGEFITGVLKERDPVA
jgi:GrpB-like predicted nucleotidyltransferase (UPF0157 family)